MIINRKANVKRNIPVDNDYGSEIDNYIDLGVVSGFFDIFTIELGEVAQKIIEDTTHIFICETSLDIKQGDRFFIDNVEYEVNFVDRPQLQKLAMIELKKTLHQNDMVDNFIYIGGTEEESLIEMDVLSFDRYPITERNFSQSVELKDKNLYIVYPKSFGKGSIRLDGKPVVDWEISELMIDGFVHYVYKTETLKEEIYIELY